MKLLLALLNDLWFITYKTLLNVIKVDGKATLS